MPLLATHEGGRTILAIDRAQAKNSLDPGMVAALREAVREAGRGDGPSVIILRSAVPGYFCTGMDLEFLAAAKEDPEAGAEGYSAIGEYVQLLRELANSPCLTLCAIGGLTVGGGVDLAAACDLIIAEESASFAISQLRNGVFPLTTSALLIPRMGRSEFLFWALSGQYYPARRAKRLGLVSQVVPDGEADRHADALARRALGYDGLALKLGLEALRFGTAAEIGERLQHARPLLGLNCGFWSPEKVPERSREKAG